MRRGARLRNRLASPQQRPERGRPEGNNDARGDHADLLLEPIVTGCDLRLRRCLVQSPLAAWLPLEVLCRRVGPWDERLPRPPDNARGERW